MGIMNLFKKSNQPTQLSIQEKEDIIFQPIDGEIIPLADIGDGVFSEGLLGKGCGLIPESESFYAPVSGTIITIAETKHAIGIAPIMELKF